MVQEILNNYPWMIYAIAICALIIIIVILILICTKSKVEDGFDTSDSIQDKIISEYLKEEKKAKEKNEIVEEYKEILPPKEEVIDKRILSSDEYEELQNELSHDELFIEDEINDTEDATNKVEHTNEEEKIKEENVKENQDMLKKKKQNTIATKTTRSSSTSLSKVKTTAAPIPKAVEKRIPNGKYEVFIDNGMYQYILKASNGEKLIESKQYTTKDNVLNAIDAVKRNLEIGKVDISKDKAGFYQFKLTAANNRPLATSANYVSEQNAKNALNSFKRFAATSPIVEVKAPVDSLSEEITVIKQELKVNGKLEISKNSTKADSKKTEWIFKLFANNGELLCTSTTYTSKDNCEKGIDTLRLNVSEGRFVVVRDKNDLYQFKLFSKSNRLIVKGQTYEDKQRAISSAHSVASFIDNAEVTTN